jgi:transposase
MRDHELYAAILGIQLPWQVTKVILDPKAEEVRVSIEPVVGSRFSCPQCGESRPGYDSRRRSWRHLDTCQFKTILEAEVPRVQCAQHGVVQIEVPWAEPNSGFTALMEALIIDWLLEASILAVSRRMRLSWDQIDGVMQRAIRRGLSRRKLQGIQHLGVDETAFMRGHEYVTVVSQRGGGVLYVADGRGQEALDAFWKELTPEQLAEIESVAMDMWRAYIRSTREHLPGADSKIAFDRFHVARAINEAVNEVRKKEHRELAAKGDTTLARTKYLWLKNPENLSEKQGADFELLRDAELKVARAWAIKETARGLWRYLTRGWARRAWTKWISWAMRCRLEPMRRVAHMVKAHLWGILNAIVMRVTNASAESLNAKIQWIKNTACGFRNRERFRNAIYFHCGQLDLYPAGVRRTHTSS